MHNWSDKWFEENGEELCKAMNYIWTRTYRFSGCKLMFKEKWGTIRYEGLWPPYTGHYIQPNWIDKLLSIFGSRTVTCHWVNEKAEIITETFHNRRFLWHDSRVCRLWRVYGRWVLGLVVHRASKKFPKVAKEILADWEPEYLG